MVHGINGVLDLLTMNPLIYLLLINTIMYAKVMVEVIEKVSCYPDADYVRTGLG
jgi:hypothetical protein